ncbi:uncharacterized protein LOC119586049 [Penaeus monodon]|uniref:uncharacterized protein LOC119586049 n=1 Tax=Penaeus monodon TaxID=6687 RepID=UPI0018A6F4FA|nr:uncharacterized protein LOC119586049 [Penaeus monodon]
MARVAVALILAAVVACVSANGMGQGQPPKFQCVEDGFFPDYYRNCMIFYSCESGVKTTFACDPDKRFDSTLNACLPTAEVSCPYPSA